ACSPLTQPDGQFVKETFTEQRYPEVKLVAGKDIVRPYDVTAWTLPLMMGVTVEKASIPAGLHPFDPSAQAKAASAGGVVAISPGSPENFKVVNAALRGGGTVSIARAAFSSGDRKFPAGTVVLDAAGAKAAGAAAVETGVSWVAVPSPPAGLEKLKSPRVGLYKPWAASMDEGWTRWLLEQYGFDPKPLDNKT